MVALAIIATISTIGLTTFSGSQEKARDTIRKNHLNSLATALEFYLQKNGQYIISPNCQTNPASSVFYTDIKEYLKDEVAPVDPVTEKAYCYISVDGLNYTLCAKLENLTDAHTSSEACGSSDYNFATLSSTPF